MASSRFERFYDDVRSGAFPELCNTFWVTGYRADGAARPPTRQQLRDQLGGLSWEGGPRWREHAQEVLEARGATRYALR